MSCQNERSTIYIDLHQRKREECIVDQLTDEEAGRQTDAMGQTGHPRDRLSFEDGGCSCLPSSHDLQNHFGTQNPQFFHYGQTDRRTNRSRDRPRDTPTYRPAVGQTDREVQTDRQTDSFRAAPSPKRYILSGSFFCPAPSSSSPLKLL